MSVVEKLSTSLVPPNIDPTLWWRIAVSGFISGIVVWIMWAMGAFAAFGMPGLARADKLENIEQKQNLTLQLTLAREICRVYFLREDARGNGPLWESLNETFERRQVEYAGVNKGLRYPAAECSRAQ
jgi:hypothetical protein